MVLQCKKNDNCERNRALLMIISRRTAASESERKAKVVSAVKLFWQTVFQQSMVNAQARRFDVARNAMPDPVDQSDSVCSCSNFELQCHPRPSADHPTEWSEIHIDKWGSKFEPQIGPKEKRVARIRLCRPSSGISRIQTILASKRILTVC